MSVISIPDRACGRPATDRGSAAAMQALVKALPEPGLVLTSVPDPAAGQDDVVVRVRRTGICGTDLHIDAWDGWAQRTVPTPLVIGHEFVGEIVEVGANVDGLDAGDLVSG